jgi:hypothetical protein
MSSSTAKSSNTALSQSNGSSGSTVQKSNHLVAAIVVPIVIAALIALGCLAFFLWYLRRRRPLSDKDMSDLPSSSSGTGHYDNGPHSPHGSYPHPSELRSEMTGGTRGFYHQTAGGSGGDSIQAGAPVAGASVASIPRRPVGTTKGQRESLILENERGGGLLGASSAMPQRSNTVTSGYFTGIDTSAAAAAVTPNTTGRSQPTIPDEAEAPPPPYQPRRGGSSSRPMSLVPASDTRQLSAQNLQVNTRGPAGDVVSPMEGTAAREWDRESVVSDISHSGTESPAETGAATKVHAVI